MSLDALLELTGTLDYEEYGFLNVEHVAASDAAVTLVVRIWPGSQDGTSQFWEVICANPLRYRLTPGEVHGYLSLLEDHPLVWEHTDPTLTLGLKGKPDDAPATVGALADKHYVVTQGWIPVERYLPLSRNYYGGLSGLLDGGHGFVATGPERIVRAYANVLETHGAGTYFLPRITNEQRTGVVSTLGDAALRVLMVNGHFVVGREFSARLLGEDTAATIPLHSVVALTEPVPDKGLRRGQVGTVVDQAAWQVDRDIFEVELNDGDGRVYARAALSAHQLLVLHHSPRAAA